ncbi:MAG: aminotransferase class V-fold PLP-dependent enzyme [Oscillospiraceae bacterium]|nr:aminotransferase class V-fold PLP-dependent enzyme [Oscillospiraceae bacterium]
MTKQKLHQCIYFDNAATTWPKPISVTKAVCRALTEYGANPGRSGYAMGIASSHQIFRCRQLAAEFFNLDNPANVVFAQSCTMALNIVLKGLLKSGGRVIVSDLEHNAVMRPLHALSLCKPAYDIARVTPGNTEKTLESFRRLICSDTKAIVCLHASNVFGIRLPIRELGRLAHQYGILFIVDGAQSAGLLPIDMQADGIDFLCVPGHKGLYGPMGIGMLLCNCKHYLPPLFEGGTGSLSADLSQPVELPDRFESGTPNTAGICGLCAGIEFVKKRGIQNILEHEMQIVKYIYHRLETMKDVILYTEYPDIERYSPVIAFNIKHRQSEDTAEALDRRGIAVRAGLHCAPSAHRHFNTLNTGAVRVAPSVFTTMRDAQYLCDCIREEAN